MILLAIIIFASIAAYWIGYYQGSRSALSVPYVSIEAKMEELWRDNEADKKKWSETL